MSSRPLGPGAPDADPGDRIGAMTLPGKGELLRLGFNDPDTALRDLAALGPGTQELLAILGQAADPDAALAGLVNLAESQGDGFVEELAEDEGTAMRLVCVLGASPALADHLARHPAQWRELADPTLGTTRPAAYVFRASLLEAVGAEPGEESPVATVADAEALDALRVEYRRWLLRLAARDLAHQLPVDDVAAELSDLACATLEAALAVARARVGSDADKVRLAVIAMGKCGGHELNYVSDVDVIFVHEAADGVGDDVSLRVATQAGQQT
ncbi:putative glutamate-ammonia-ligase adenylyltransferase [Nocardioidaceae bacterium Broad-1]|nr:putative glutamate-ammonia-ligase adenylyltransferase [Nocardioidaceae bacterium Broad-1]